MSKGLGIAVVVLLALVLLVQVHLHFRVYKLARKYPPSSPPQVGDYTGPM